ncbi:CD276 antigen-like [Scomber scombrus]|uniref:CD276 antigen-like n=1 Tax=Scomber scombrus TaxID=13677 RepID=UPI002DD9EA35|nr:CD276 antigen-like [Scomber scombrus]
MELLLLVFFCLLTGSEVTFGAENEPEVITVDEGSDVILPCSFNTTDITNKKFEWKKDGRQVFLYDEGYHSNIVNTVQDQQFKGRVEHFPDKLKSGNASIIISNIKVTDSGEYTCEFPNLQPSQIFYIQLRVLVEAPQPSVKILDQRKFSAELQCEVRGAFPKPELHWEDGAGNKLLARDPQESERGRLYDIILQTIVTKTDIYHCVATQEEINHQTHDDIYVHITEKTIIIMGEGGDVILPCSLNTKEDITNNKFVWKKGGCLMFLYDKGPVNDNNQTQDQQFKGRVSHFRDELKSGNASIIIRDMKKADTGNYTCEFPDLQPSQIFHIKLVLEPTIIRVEEGRDATLPCSLSSRQDITSEKFEWKKDGRQVFLYDNGPVNDNSQTQDKQFKGRVKHFPDELKSGKTSITIRDMKKADTGNYTCEFPDLQPSQIFHIKLVFAPNPRDDETAGLLANETDGGAVKDSGV